MSTIKVRDLQPGDRVAVTMIDPQRPSALDWVEYLNPQGEQPADPRLFDVIRTVVSVSPMTPELAEEKGSWLSDCFVVTWQEESQSRVFEPTTEFEVVK